jgi:hypothetical protein
MQSKSKMGTLLILGATAFACSRAVFAFLRDTEGPNLVVVTGLAVFIYALSLAFYLSKAVSALTSLGWLLVAIVIQLFAAFALCVVLR